jgi:hypothetical protein
MDDAELKVPRFTKARGSVDELWRRTGRLHSIRQATFNDANALMTSVLSRCLRYSADA